MRSSVCFCNDFILSVKEHVGQLYLLSFPPQTKLQVGHFPNFSSIFWSKVKSGLLENLNASPSVDSCKLKRFMAF